MTNKTNNPKHHPLWFGISADPCLCPLEKLDIISILNSSSKFKVNITMDSAAFWHVKMSFLFKKRKLFEFLLFKWNADKLSIMAFLPQRPFYAASIGPNPYRPYRLSLKTNLWLMNSSSPHTKVMTFTLLELFEFISYYVTLTSNFKVSPPLRQVYRDTKWHVRPGLISIRRRTGEAWQIVIQTRPWGIINYSNLVWKLAKLHFISKSTLCRFCLHFYTGPVGRARADHHEGT